MLSRRAFLSGFALPLAAANDTDPSFKSGVEVVNVIATVRDREGKIVRDLTQDDFVLQQDGRIQPIQYFSRDIDLGLTIGLLVDTSLSQRRILGDQQRASFQFLEKVLREDKDQAFVFRFDFDVEMLQDVTSSRRKLKDSLAVLELPHEAKVRGRARGHLRGGTTLFDAVLLGADEVMRNQTGRKALLVLSDGVDTGSKVKIADAIEMAQRADTMVYGILYEDRELYRQPPMITFPGGGRRGRPARVVTLPNGRKAMKRLSEETGGGYFEVSKKASITDVFTAIEEELRSQYSLGFKPAAGGAPGFRKLSLTVKRKGHTVSSRDGYWVGDPKSAQ